MHKNVRMQTLVWLILMGLTVSAVYLASTIIEGLTVAVALLTLLKGRLIIDHFMELADANTKIRGLVRLWAALVPALMIVTTYYGPLIARMTSLD